MPTKASGTKKHAGGPAVGMPQVTVQADVGPGNKTGIYYITICNLPFATSWKSLKDWVKQVCKVDHVEVFQSSTSGWVRVCGEKNFDKAWDLLNGGVFEGRSIIASDKNRTSAIKIKELVDNVDEIPQAQRQSKPPTRRSHPRAVAVTSHCYATRGQGPRGENPPLSSTNPTQRTMLTPRFRLPYAQGAPGTHGASSSMSSTPYGALRKSFRPATTTSHTADNSSRYITGPGPGSCYNTPVDECTVTEKRKILVKNFSTKITTDEIRLFIRRKLGPYQNRITKIDVPKVPGSYAEPRGHAFVIFRDEEAAAIAIGRLHNRPARGGDLLYARFTHEGVTTGDFTKSAKRFRPQLRNHGHRQPQSCISRRGSSRDDSASDSAQRTEEHEIKGKSSNGLVIADGSRNRGKH